MIVNNITIINGTSMPHENECLTNLSDLKEQIFLLTNQISDIQQQLDEKKQQNQELQMKMFEIQKQSVLTKQNLVNLNHQLIQKNKQITKDNKKHQHELFNIFNIMNGLRVAIDKIEKQKSEYELLLKQSEEKIAKLTDENNCLNNKSKNDSTETAIKLLQEENAKLLDQNKKYQQVIAKLKIKKNQKQRNFKPLETRVHHFSKKNTRLKKKLRISGFRILHLMKRIGESENEVSRLKELLATREDEIRECRDEIDEARYVIHKMRAGSCEGPLQQVKSIEQVEDVVRSLQIMCEDLENANHRLFLEMNELKRSNARFKRLNKELLAKQNKKS